MTAITEVNTTQHPTVCFGVSRHNVIIPLKVIDVVDYNDGCVEYTFDINHPNPSDYLKCHQKADFDTKFVSVGAPLCDRYTKIRLTLEEAKQLITKQLKRDRASAMSKVNDIDKSLAKIDADVAALEADIKKV
jgi:hypothetical protein